MRHRDYIHADPRDAHRAAVREAVEPLYDARRYLNRCFEGAFDHRVVGTDPINIYRAWGTSNVELWDIAATLTPPSNDKIWQRASIGELSKPFKSMHRWKCAALKLNPDTTDPIAVSGMHPVHHAGHWQLGIAWPAPKPCTAMHCQAPVEDIVLIDPKTGHASLIDTNEPWLVRSADTERFTVHADPLVWAREFATARLEWVYARQQARRVANIEPVWLGAPSSALAIGPVDKIDWPMGIEVVTAGVGIDARILARIIKRRQPQIHTPMHVRAA